MLTFTIGFIKRGDEILLLNREKPSWMGSWNGVGGKLEKDETPEECILREVREETGIELQQIAFKGTVTWTSNGKYDGMYAFIGKIPKNHEYITPIKTDEGILDWKKLEWIFHQENTGVANLKYFLGTMLQEKENFDHHFVYENGDVITFERREIQLTEKAYQGEYQ